MNHPALSLPCAKRGCGPFAETDGPEQVLCHGCGLIFRAADGDVVVDAAATRGALFAAAAACAGPDCSLQALAFDRYGSNPLAYDRLVRFALAENGVASLGYLGW